MGIGGLTRSCLFAVRRTGPGGGGWFRKCPRLIRCLGSTSGKERAVPHPRDSPFDVPIKQERGYIELPNYLRIGSPSYPSFAQSM